MRWWRDRHGHGPLAIRHDRRALERVHPVARQLRARRVAMLRRRWKDFAVLAGLFLLICCCAALPSNTSPLWRGYVLGFCAGLLAAMVAVLVLLLDGSLLRRLGRSVESDVGDDLRTLPGVYGVVSTVLFDGCDVDHVVLTPSGIWALEVKWSMTPADDLAHVWGLPRHLEQTRQAARKVRGLLRSSAVGVPVHPVLVLAGPGMPQVGPSTIFEGIRVVNSTSRRGWKALLVEGKVVWTLEEARGAADALVRLRDTRIDFEERRTHVPSRGVAKQAAVSPSQPGGASAQG